MQDDMNDFGEIKAKVSNLQTGHDQLRQEIGSVRGEVANLDAKTSQGFDKILARIDSKFDSVNSTVNSRSQSIWAPLGIAVSALLTLGGWAYSGINEKANKTDLRVEKTADHLAETQKELSFLKGQLHPLGK
jgi:peptidoglycan hydrolase CwlO-like protein